MTNIAKKTLINISKSHLGLKFLEENWENDVVGMQNLEHFLNTENSSTIYASIQKDDESLRINFLRELSLEHKFDKIVIFSKIKPCIIGDDDILMNLQINCLKGPPTLALYNTLSNVFTPFLQLEKQDNVYKQMASLQAGLRSKLISSQSIQEDNDKDNDLLALAIVNSLEEEVQYWDILSHSTSKRDKLARTSSASFRDILRPLVRDFTIIDALSMNDLEDMLERTHNILDDLWHHEPPFPKERMKHLMDLVADDVRRSILKQAQEYDIWSENDYQVFERLNQFISICSKWLTSCQQLTEIFWPNYTTNPWRDEVHQPRSLVELNGIFQEVLNARIIHKQLNRLLTNEEQENLKFQDMFRPFKDISILTSDSKEILRAQKKFQYLLEPAEKQVALKFKKQFTAISVNTRQLLYEFSRYTELIRRPVLKAILQSDRQHLLNSLFDHVKQIQTQISGDFSNDKFSRPQIVTEISHSRILENNVLEIQNVAENLLDDIPNYENLMQILNELAKELKQQHIELFESWSSEIVSYIHDNSLSLRISDPVVHFSKQKYMRVNYSPRLVTLISEVRQLKAMGYHIPSIIDETSAQAKKFMQYARTLEQIANFHNTIGDRMIPSQQPMMLASALELSKLVQEEEVVRWENERSVEKYVSVLKGAVEKLSRENNLLTSYHRQILERIKAMEDVDLIKDYSKWRECGRFIRDIMNQVEEKGFKNMQNWRNDVDKKLCDVLENHYIQSLDTLHLYLPEIHTDLVYRNSMLEFAPSEEALKKQYEQQLKKFLDIPKTFGVMVDSINTNIFSEIIERNTDALKRVEKHKNELFEQLQSVIKHWQSWLQLDALDKSKLSTWQHWDLHFRASKTFGQEIAKLPSTEERVGCFMIGLSRLRSDLEAHNRSYWDQLVYSLKDSIAEDVVKLQNYVDPSTATLTRQPVTIEEVGESDVAHSSIMDQFEEMEKTFEEMVKKNQILASWAREGVDSVNRMKGAWSRLQSLLENHQHIIAKQMETIKTTLNIEVENLNKEIERFSAKMEQNQTRQFSTDVGECSFEELYNHLQLIKNRQVDWGAILEKRDNLKSTYSKFHLEAPEIPAILAVEGDLEKESSNWTLFEEFYDEMEPILKEYWIVTRKKLHVFEDCLIKWQDKLKETESSDLVARMLKEIDKLQQIIPALKFVKGDDFSDKHWNNVYNLLNMEIKAVDQLQLNDFVKVADKLELNTKELQMICKKAASEIVVRQALSELDQWEIQARFIFTSHNDSNGKPLMLIKDYKDILNKIGDNQSLLQSVKNSADYESFSERANLWETKLSDLDFYLTSLMQIQRKWIYLEPIFGSGTLAQERSRFERIERDFRHILTYVEKDPRVVLLCRYPNLRPLIENILDQLARCQNSLDNFLMDKRNKFPRFLFLSDDDLLEVVGQSSKEQVIQTHLKKLFAGIHQIELDESEASIVALLSSDGERVPLNQSVNIKDRPVEDWLNEMVIRMQLSLKELLVNCLNERQAPDPLNYPSQILCLASSINFTTKCEQAITSMTLPPLLAKYKSQLSYYSSQELNGDIEGSFSSGNVTDNVLELKLKALLLDTIHQINTLKELLDANTTKVADWMWQKQLRYYANSSGDVQVHMANARLNYSFEYLGNAPKLVRTPLTERCFLTLTQSMYLGMGGNPYGPAGTGKTESVKALGGLLGRQVLVFNCDEGVDATSMGRILSGLVRSGAWGCFDEFNRLDEATLSAVSMLIQPIQVALKSNQSNVTLLDKEIPLNRYCGIFVTLNPAGGGYGGRNKLPDNLKLLFRPVVMTHPDNEEIARSLLHCDGYQNADLIAHKIVEVFESANKLLSKQQHYDWGLRAVRTILTSCGWSLKHIKRQIDTISAEQELGIVVKVLRMDTLSKLTYTDSIKFDGIISSVFRNVTFEAMENESLLNALKDVYEGANLVHNERQINKCMELYRQLKQRMGVAIVGPPSCGKTTTRNLLQKALSKLGHNIKQYAFNPKSMPRYELLGQTDLDTKQWNDGVLTSYSLQVASEPTDVWSWIVCDGDVDPEWIESLNSVLDDNRLLSLPSGWRIQFGANVNFIFETHDLSYASPATISRMGIVFLNEEDLSVDIFINSYLKQLDEEAKIVLEHLINDYFLRSLNWLTDDGEVTVHCSKVAMANTGLSQLIHARSKAEFIVQLINGLGQLLQVDFREFFAQQIYEWTGEIAPPNPMRSRYNNERGMIDVYHTNPNTQIDDISNGIPLVMTGQIMQYVDTLRNWVDRTEKQHFLIIGPHGAAKTLMLKHITEEISDMELVTVHCSANLMPSFVINKLKQHCISVNTHRGKVYKPKRNNVLLYFKNLHLLEHDKWGTNMLIEFLNQIITYKGFYDSNVEFIGLENVTIVGSLLPVQTLSVRFTSNLHYFNVDLPDGEDLNIIILAYLMAILKHTFHGFSFPKAKATKFVAAMITVYNKVRSSFTVLQRKHYIFAPDDLIKWCSSILRYKFIPDGANHEENLIEVFVYEGLHLFGDKLVNLEDYARLCTIINETVYANWGKSNVIQQLNDCFFVPQMNSKEAVLEKLTKSEWTSTVQLGIHQCEREGQALNVLITEELLDLTATISKSVCFPRGNIVLIGRSGAGRRTAIKIISSLQSAKLIVPQNNLNTDLKSAMQYAGIDGEQVFLQIEDYLLMDKRTLNVVNFLMSSGEVPGLYTNVELEALVKGLKEESDRRNFEGDLLQFFYSRLQENMHIIICLDVDNEMLDSILQTCPAFLQKATLVWKTGWSETTLEAIPQMIIEKYNETITSKVHPSNKFFKIYKLLSESLSDPSRYISMISLYKTIYEEKMLFIQEKQNKLKAGVSKLTEASELVRVLKEKALIQEQKLAEKQEKANTALDMISSTMKNASQHKEEMESLKDKTEKENEQLKIRKKEIELELADVEPLIQEARSAVGNIKSESLSEIRSLRAPPEVIRDILEGVLRLMGIQDTSWNSMKTFLAKRGIKEEIRSFDASRITKENRVSVEKLVSNKSDSFDSKAAKRASVAAAPLAAWVLANIKYSHVLQKIQPLETEQNKLKQNLKVAENQLGELSVGLSEVDVTVAKLKEQLSAYTKEAAEIEIDLNKAQATLVTAEGLVSKLNDEFERWQEQLKEFSQQIEQLPDNCILAAAFAIYLSSESEEKRMELLNAWSYALNIKNFHFEAFMATEREQMQWQSEGLSSDKLSIENAIIITKTKTVPLLIDPTSSALNWVKNHLKSLNIECTSFNAPKFVTMLELAIRFGKIFIIEEVESVNPILLPILRKDFVYQGERKLIKLNGKLMDYHNDFKLILSSRNEHLNLPAYIVPLISVMNFTVTRIGLTDQLLSAAIKQENPELENRRKQLLREKEEMQEKLYWYQNQLLDELATSSGDILQNTQLMKSLNETKASSISIQSALRESGEIQVKLQSEYDIYREISEFGSKLYFACNEFSKWNRMYVLSVAACTRLFLKSLQTFQELDNSLNLQQKHLFNAFFQYFSRGIFTTDRISFALHLLFKMYPKEISSNEWNLFMGHSNAKSEPDSGQLPSWVPKNCVLNVNQMQINLPEVYKTLQLHEATVWSTFMSTNECETQFPKHCDALTSFQKVILVQILRPDRLYSTILQFVYKVTGLKTLNTSIVNLSQVYNETMAAEPILLITMSGTDPSSEIRQLCENSAENCQLKEIAMGEGQETNAINALMSATQNGEWLILKNLHLVTGWLTILSQNLKNIEPHQSFRLWLISEPTPNFNFVLALNSLKIVCEASQGIKNNLQRSFASFGNKYFSKLSSTHSRIFFVIAYLHGLMQERRKYVPQGWSKYYEFSDADFSTCIRLIEDLWHRNSQQIPWKFISGVCTEAVYGGRIENMDDMRIMYSYMREYLCDDVLSHRWRPVSSVDLPNAPQFQEYINAIRKIPNKDEPGFFGLPENIDRSWELQESNKIVQQLRSVYLKKSILNGAFDRDSFYKGLAPLMNLWKKLNHGQDFLKITPTPAKSGSIIEMFITDEYFGALNLVQFIHKCFMSLNKVCKGVSVANEQDITIGNCLINFETPQLWQKIWKGPKEPYQYLRTIVNKLINLSPWQNIQSEQLLRKPISLSCLFHPEALLTSHKQEYAKTNNVAMDELELENSWHQSANSKAIIISDLLIEGALFDGRALKPSSPTSENTTTVPNCYLSWKVKKTEMPDEKCLQVPVYTNSTREIQVLSIQVPIEERYKEKWIQSGLCFYLEN